MTVTSSPVKPKRHDPNGGQRDDPNARHAWGVVHRVLRGEGFGKQLSLLAKITVPIVFAAGVGLAITAVIQIATLGGPGASSRGPGLVALATVLATTVVSVLSVLAIYSLFRTRLKK
jgi:hypothetical protein